MRHSRRELLIAAAGTTLLAGCVGDDDDGDNGDDGDSDDEMGGDSDDMDDTDPGDDGEEDPPDATVQVGATDDFGEILVGSEELSLYMFDSDEAGAEESTCYDECADNWPPLTVDEDPVAGDDVGAELGTFEREDGEMQVTAGGWPLYYWAADEEPGDVDGQGVNDVWWLVSPDGEPVTEEAQGSPDGGPY